MFFVNLTVANANLALATVSLILIVNERSRSRDFAQMRIIQRCFSAIAVCVGRGGALQ